MTPEQKLLIDFYATKGVHTINPAILPEYIPATITQFVVKGLKPVLTGKPTHEQEIVAHELVNRAQEQFNDRKAKEAGYGHGSTEGPFGWFDTTGSDYTFECVARLIMNPGSISQDEFEYLQIINLNRTGRYDEAVARFSKARLTPSAPTAPLTSNELLEYKAIVQSIRNLLLSLPK